MMRPLIQYDLYETGPPPAASPTTNTNHSTRRPPAKKRRRNQHQQHRPSVMQPAAPARAASLQHWDDPGSTAHGVVYDDQKDVTAAEPGPATTSHTDAREEDAYDDEAANGDGDGDEPMNGAEEEEEEESRPLTHEDIWDDSALIDAWNSAEAEYEAYHGTTKTWKTEPVKKSPLWYNKPYTALPQSEPQAGPSKLQLPQKHQHAPADAEPEPDTAPLDFNTYVPTHDASLGIPPASNENVDVHPAPNAPFFLPPSSSTAISPDEAFQNALSAMYWGGYWTAVYQCQSRSSGKDSVITPDTALEDNEIEVEENVDESEEDLVPTQR